MKCRARGGRRGAAGRQRPRPRRGGARHAARRLRRGRGAADRRARGPRAWRAAAPPPRCDKPATRRRAVGCGAEPSRPPGPLLQLSQTLRSRRQPPRAFTDAARAARSRVRTGARVVFVSVAHPVHSSEWDVRRWTTGETGAPRSAAGDELFLRAALDTLGQRASAAERAAGGAGDGLLGAIDEARGLFSRSPCRSPSFARRRSPSPALHAAPRRRPAGARPPFWCCRSPFREGSASRRRATRPRRNAPRKHHHHRTVPPQTALPTLLSHRGVPLRPLNRARRHRRVVVPAARSPKLENRGFQ